MPSETVAVPLKLVSVYTRTHQGKGGCLAVETFSELNLEMSKGGLAGEL